MDAPREEVSIQYVRIKHGRRRGQAIGCLAAVRDLGGDLHGYGWSLCSGKWTGKQIDAFYATHSESVPLPKPDVFRKKTGRQIAVGRARARVQYGYFAREYPVPSSLRTEANAFIKRTVARWAK